MMLALAFSLKASRSDLFQREEVSFEWCGDDIVRYERRVERLVSLHCGSCRAVGEFFSHTFYNNMCKTLLTRNDPYFVK